MVILELVSCLGVILFSALAGLSLASMFSVVNGWFDRAITASRALLYLGVSVLGFVVAFNLSMSCGLVLGG